MSTLILPKPRLITGEPDEVGTNPFLLGKQAVAGASAEPSGNLNPPAVLPAASVVERFNGHGMPIYFFGGAIEQVDSEKLELHLRRSLPQLKRIEGVEQLHQRLLPDRSYLLFPFPDASFDRLIDMAANGRDDIFFIFIGNEIAASDYKRLVRTGHADWVSARGASQEILDILAQHQRAAKTAEADSRGEFMLVSFLPSSGGVGNATLAIETAVQIKTQKATKDLAVCLVDLDFQTGHVCDLLDLDPRLKVTEISHTPDRLDAQLMDLFVSHHASGVDVVASLRSKDPSTELSIAALDALFAMLSQRYDVVIVDLPVHWFDWTRQILSASNLTVVTGLNTIPGLRQVVDTVKAVQGLIHAPAQVAVALNRCKSRLMGGMAGQRFVKRVLGGQKVIYVRDDAAAAKQSANTGVPVSLEAPLSGISKDIAKLGALVCALRPRPLAAAALE